MRSGRPTNFKRGRARSVGSFVPQLTKKVFEKYGFSTWDLVANWAAIVGEDLAISTAPQRLKWPRRAGNWGNGDAGSSEQGGAGGQTDLGGATLVLSVDGGRALDVQYHARQIIERINAYFGYRAVREIRIIQAPVVAPGGGLNAGSRKPDSLSPKDVISTEKPNVRGITDDGLRAALERLGSSVLGEKAARKAG